MAADTQPICFHCGQSAAVSTRFNRLPDGRPCPACAERLLASLAPPLPGYDPANETLPEQVEASEPDTDYDASA